MKGDPGEDFEEREKYMKIVGILKEGLGQGCEFHLVKGGHHFHMEEEGVGRVGGILGGFFKR